MKYVINFADNFFGYLLLLPCAIIALVVNMCTNEKETRIWKATFGREDDR